MSTTIEHTADELFANPPDGPWELVRGELRQMSPAGSKHGWVISRTTRSLTAFVEDGDLGYVFGAETGFVIETDPDTVRAPDVAFVRKDRVDGELPDQFFPGAPDIAIEVLSPSDSASSVQEKSEDWLNAGCHEVWLVDPRRKTASRCELTESGMVTLSVTCLTSDLLDGFELQVSSIFE
jgi:Uma2 family endonuclease